MKYDIYNKTGDVLFTAEIGCKEDTPDAVKKGLAVKWALENKVSLAYADLDSADLRGANLSGVNVRGANLKGADLRGADLYGTNLSGANLSGVNVRGADLRDVNVRGADLYGANLSGANLSGANLYGANLYLLQTDIWTVHVQPEHIRIGCQYHTAEQWFSFSDEEIDVMSPEALDWWRKWKAPIQAIHATFKGE